MLIGAISRLVDLRQGSLPQMMSRGQGSPLFFLYPCLGHSRSTRSLWMLIDMLCLANVQ